MIYNSPKAFMCSLKNVNVYLRNNELIYGRLKHYDKHFNLVIKIDKNREVFIRGDSVITIVRK